MERETELIIRLTALKDVEIWLNEQYLQIELELSKLKQERDNA